MQRHAERTTPGFTQVTASVASTPVASDSKTVTFRGPVTVSLAASATQLDPGTDDTTLAASVTYDVVGGAAVGKTVDFGTTYGDLSALNCVTDGTGQCTVTLSRATSPDYGLATVTASVSGAGNTPGSETIAFRQPWSVTLIGRYRSPSRSRRRARTRRSTSTARRRRGQRRRSSACR